MALASCQLSLCSVQSRDDGSGRTDYAGRAILEMGPFVEFQHNVPPFVPYVWLGKFHPQMGESEMVRAFTALQYEL